MTPTNVGKIFQLPLQESQAAKFTYLMQAYIQSNDLGYTPTGRCSTHENGSFSCWAQVNEAIFNVSIWASLSVSVIEDIPLPFTNLKRFTEEPILLTPIGKIIFEHLDMEVLYDPNAKTAVVYYVYCRAMERRPCGIANDRSFKVTQIL